eukprot:TRINITY_DN3405_c0_g4_i1.p1 TRINITY_DN3405_c0_g4~~TRINITY_DN3405_c0_g4_i1.p1  ORF type:complete len:400 (-),score=144.44 TRINITY_DN3405_c0_g4_i1:52-1251(-)
MYKQSRDTERLSAADLLALFKDAQGELQEEIKSEGSNEGIAEDIEEKQDQEISESINESKHKGRRKFRLPISHSLPQEQSDNPLIPSVMQLAEEEIIETAKKVFSEIARMFQLSGVSPEKHFEDVIMHQGNEQLVPSDKFLEGIEALGIGKLSPKSQDCLLKVLAAAEDDKYVRFNDFMQVINDYTDAVQNNPHEEASDEVNKTENMDESKKSVKEDAEESIRESAKEEGTKEEFPMKIHQLNKLSMIVMLALAEYLQRESTTIEDLFEDKTYKQLVKTKAKQRTIDILNTVDFFAALGEIGINIDEELDNLKYFLCLDKNYSDKIHLKKLVKVVKEFTENERLRDYARECYQELLGDNEGDEKEDHGKTEEELVEETMNNAEGYSNQDDSDLNCVTIT